MIVRLLLFAAFASAAPALADEPLTARYTYARNSDFFATGATLAVSTDSDNNVDSFVQPNSVQVGTNEIPPNATLQQALLYWGGTVPDFDACSPNVPSTIDDTVSLAVPGGPGFVEVTADDCYCADGENQNYDIQSCRADVTAEANGALTGVWSVGDFDAFIDNGSTHNASFAIVLIYGAPDLPQRKITIYDGVQTMRLNSITFTLDNLEVDDPPAADLTWYVLEGDEGGSDTEEVRVAGFPSGGVLQLSGPDNPPNNPMNRTINTTVPPQAGVTGVDIDAFDVSAALAPGDTAVEVTYTADSDKWWPIFNIVGVNIFFAAFQTSSTHEWTLLEDRDADGEPSPGDIVRYEIGLQNDGTGGATVDVSVIIDPNVESWTLVQDGGGVDSSSPSMLRVTEIDVGAGGNATLRYDVELAPQSAGQTVEHRAEYFAEPDGVGGLLVASPLVVAGDAGDDDDDAADDDDSAGDDDDILGDDDDDDDDDGGSRRLSGCGCEAASGGSMLALLLLGFRRRR